MSYSTLRQKLTERNEFALNGFGAQGCDTKDNQWPNLCDSIRVWNDLSLEGINRTLGVWLDCPIQPQDIQLPKFSPPNVNGHSAEAARDMRLDWMTDWVLNTILAPANFTAPAVLGWDKDCRLLATRSLIDQPRQSNILPSIPPPYKPRIDIFVSAAFQPRAAILIGFCKSQHSVTSAALRGVSINSNSSSIWALRRLAYLCQLSSAHHGFIHTDIELIACKFNFVSERGFTVEICAVSLYAHGTDALTSNLVMWALTMLATYRAAERGLLDNPFRYWT